MSKELDELIKLTNEELKADGVRVRVYKRDGTNVLSVRAKLPPKPGKTGNSYHQFINLKLTPTKLGVKQAALEARQLDRALRNGYFDWGEYLPKEEKEPEKVSAADWIAAYKKDWEARVPQTEKSKETWQDGYLRAFNLLKQDLILDRANVLQAINRSEAHSRTRQKTCNYIASLLEFASAPAELVKEVKSLRGNYSHRSVKMRELPTDEEIVYWRAQIENPKHRWMYGMLACYGLRNHELWYCEPSSLAKGSNGILEILPGAKTVAHFVWPFYPQWFDRWELWDIPDITTTARTNSAKGELITQIFERNNIPFRPYALRHAWAVRTLAFNVDIAQAARQQAHSVEVHCRVYHQHIQKKEVERAFQIMMGQGFNEPPQPPPDPPLKVRENFRVHKEKRTPVSKGMRKEEAAKLYYPPNTPCPFCKCTKGRWKGWAESNGLVWGKRKLCSNCNKYQTIAPAPDPSLTKEVFT